MPISLRFVVKGLLCVCVCGGGDLLAGIFDKGKNLSKRQSYKYINDVCLKNSLESKIFGT